MAHVAPNFCVEFPLKVLNVQEINYKVIKKDHSKVGTFSSLSLKSTGKCMDPIVTHAKFT